MNDHARFHMPEAICCNYCSKIFVDKEDGDLHYEFAHKDLEPSFGNVEENSATLNCVKEICFPNIASTYNRDDDHTVAALPVEKIEKCGQNSMSSSSNNMFAATMIMNDLKNKVSSSSGVKSAPFSRTISSNKSRGANIKPPSPVHLEGRVQCRICSQWISLNPNSIDVHVKNHLEFKQHVCGYCPYRSCIIGKVKRHLDSVHKNEPMKVLSFTQTSAKLKSIVLDARSICFLLGDPSDKDYEPDVLAEMLDNTRIQLDEELTALSENMSASDKILARCSGPQVNAGHQKLSMEHFFSDTTSSANNNNSKSNISLNHNSTSTTTRKSNSTTNFAAATLDELQHQNNMTDFCAQFLSTPDEDDDSPSINLLNEFLDRPDDDITDVFLDGLNPTCCRLCEKNLPEHTTTMDFHARNHLTYKPFHCDLCNYKSSLEAKVKRHLHVVHNCSQADDRVVFSPAPSVLEKLHQIKVACFGDKFSAVKSNDPRLMGSAESHEKLFDVEDSIEDYRRLHEMLEEDQLENSLTASDVVNNVPLSHCKETSIHMEDNHERVEITCNICCESVPNDNLSKTKHMTKHVGDFEYRCQYCDFVSFVNQETVKHSAAEHPNEPPRAGRYNLSSHMASAAYERLADQCFSEQDRKNRSDNAYNRVMRTFNSFGDEEENLNGNADDAEMGSSAEPASDEEPLPVDNAETLTFSSSKFDTFNVDGTKYICRLCQTAVSMHSSSLYVHVKNHMNYKPYVCGYCDYRSPVKSKVRRHIINQHKTISGSPIVHYIPRPGVDKDILRWKIKCFPETASHAAAALAVLNSGAAPTIAAASSSLSKHRPSMSFEETHREIRRNSQHIVDVARDKPTATLHAAQPLSSKTTLQAAGTASTSKSGLSVDRAAPSSMAAISAITSGGSDRIPCLLCKMVVADNPGSKGIHAKNHLNSKPFHCAYCSYKSCLRGETKRHLNRQHPAMAMSIAFKEDEVATKIELDDMIERCFLTGEPKDASSTERPNNHNRIKDPNKKKGKLEPETKFQREETVASIAAATPPSDSQTSKTSKIETSKNNSSYCNNRRKSEPQKVTVNSDKNNSSACYNLRTTRSTTKKLMEFDSSD
uniref:C2H2-type domain-containing protein n=1 Tax=Romanomermis culicivorax TaxID=13658 RepID=A0A915KUI6_ROMCU